MIGKEIIKISVFFLAMLFPLFASLFLPPADFGSSVLAAEEK